jgi:uncharacterized protein YbjT (DUF2867 family)
MSVARRALVTGATGFVGGRLASKLADRDWEVRCLVRDGSRARGLAEDGFELHEADVLDADALRGAGRDVEVGYYLIHSMGRGAAGDFEERERQAARNFAEMAKREGIARVVYLGGLGDRPQSTHLRSRRRTAEVLSELGPPLTYFRAGMVVGAESESYRTLKYLVQRLPAMIGPAAMKGPRPGIANSPTPASSPSVPPITPPVVAPAAAPSGAFVTFSVPISFGPPRLSGKSTEMSDMGKPALTSESAVFSTAARVE